MTVRDLDPPRGRNINRRSKASRCTGTIGHRLWGASSLSPANVLDRLLYLSPPPPPPTVLLSRRSFIIYVLIYYNRSSAAFDPYRALALFLPLSLSLFLVFSPRWFFDAKLAQRDQTPTMLFYVFYRSVRASSFARLSVSTRSVSHKKRNCATIEIPSRTIQGIGSPQVVINWKLGPSLCSSALLCSREDVYIHARVYACARMRGR